LENKDQKYKTLETNFKNVNKDLYKLNQININNNNKLIKLNSQHLELTQLRQFL